MNCQSLTRVLAVDVRRTRFGYALLEGPKRLLDWGASAVSPKLRGRTALETARRRIAPILRRCHPTAVVIKRPRQTRTGRSSTPGPVLRAILRETAALRLSVTLVTSNEIFGVFSEFRCRNKDDIAEVLVQHFPELMARLPPRRGKWGTERARMVIFDALAAGVTYWERNPPPE